MISFSFPYNILVLQADGERTLSPPLFVIDIDPHEGGINKEGIENV